MADAFVVRWRHLAQVTFKDTVVKDLSSLNLEGNIEATLADDVVVSCRRSGVVDHRQHHAARQTPTSSEVSGRAAG